MRAHEIESALKWRYATKVFDPNRVISPENWETLENCLVLSPSSYGLQPWKFLVVQNPELRKELRTVSWNQSQVTDCSHYLVFACLETMDEAYIAGYVAHTAKVRGLPVEKLQSFHQSMMGDLVEGPRAEVIEPWAQRQAYIAMGFLMQSAALLEIDTCPLEGLDPDAYDKMLKLEGTGYKTVAAVALGYRSSTDKYQSIPKVRFEKDKIIEWIR